MGKPRRLFTREFKVEAVKLVTEQGRSFAEAAANLGIAENLLRKWKKAIEGEGNQAFPGKGTLPTLEEELRRLRAENKRLQMERDILKKATAFFAKESLGDTASLTSTARTGRCG
jgi:transposase